MDTSSLYIRRIKIRGDRDITPVVMCLTGGGGRDNKNVIVVYKELLGM
jgi:hypothetical protein